MRIAQLSLALLLVGLVASTATQTTGLQPARQRRGQEANISNDIRTEEQENEVDGRIVVSEPYKSLLQTAARMALAQTRLPNHINMDTAMNLINDTGYMLSKPAILAKVGKLAAVLLASLLATLLLFPSAHKFLEQAYRDPANSLNLDRYFSNGLHEKSILAAIGSKTDDALSRVGLQDGSCRERSLCYVGEILKCSFPRTAETITRFASDNFSNTGFKDNSFARAFAAGFVDRNCTRVATEAPESHSCLASFINSVLSAPGSRSPKQK